MTRTPFIPLIASLLLTASASAQQPALTLPRNMPVPATARTKGLPLSEVFSRTASTANCLGNAFELPGQAWHTDMTGGGITLNAAPNLDARPPTFEASYGFPAAWLDARSADSEIKIVDHFTFAPLKIRTQRGEETLMLNHGALVEAHLRALLESAGFTLRRQKPMLYGRGDRTVTISRLDLSSQVYPTRSLGTGGAITSAALAQALQQELESDGKSLKPKDLVLNMSFAMIPCQAMNVYRETRDQWASATPARRYTMNTFLSDVAQASNLSLTEVQRALTTVSDLEPVRRTIRAFATEKRARNASFNAVASSGNFGLNYASAPGAFPEVISAGLHTWDHQPAKDTDGSVWPDAADVNVPGEWFTLSSVQLLKFCQQGGSCITQDLAQDPRRYSTFAYRGTSFAAPAMSLFLALQQGPSNHCFDQDGTGYAPIAKGSLSQTFNFAQAWQQCEKQN